MTPHEAYIFLPSFAQQRLWFLDQLAPGMTAYNLPSAVRLSGCLDLPALEQSLDAIIRRHEAIRTTFATVDGQLVQVVAPEPAQPADALLPLVDLRHLPGPERDAEIRRLAMEEARRPFDLEHGPLLRAGLLRVDDDEHVLLLTMHHIISDGWSLGVLVRELVALYSSFAAGQASPLAPLPIQYADYAMWQREWLTGEVLEAQLDYWRQQLDPAGSGTPTLDLPTDWPRPAVQSFRGARCPFTIDRSLTDALNRLSRHEGATLFMTLLATFNVLLARYTHQSDIVVGSPIANRTQDDLEGLIGFFANTLALRTDLSGQPSFRDLLGRVRETALGAYAHQELPFELLVEELQPQRDLSRNPLFQAMFVLQNAPIAVLEAPDLVLQPLTFERDIALFDISLVMEETPAGLRGVFEYATDLFEATTIERMIGQFQQLLVQIAADAEQRVWSLPLLTAAEQQAIDDWNATVAEFSADRCVHDLFVEQAARTPDAIAVVADNQNYTYAELDRRANRLAHDLRAIGVGPEVRVGVCMERSLDLIVALLGVLKAGGAYVPIDLGYPQERTQFILADAAIAVVLTQTRLQDSLPALAIPVVCVDRDLPQHPDTPPEVAVDPDNLAYIIYTSGSTGQPKGVAVPHRSLVNHNLAVAKEYVLEASDRVLQFSSPSFDVAAEEIYPCWLSGATLVLCPDACRASLIDFLAFVERERLTLVNLPTSFWHEWVAALTYASSPLPESLRLVIVGSEATLPDRVAEWLRLVGDRVGWINAYGLTETTITSTIYAPDFGRISSSLANVPIGRPIANTQIHLLDRYLRPVPIGAPGELCIAGLGLTRGYLDRPDLTAERFVPNPFASEPGTRLYRTGDLARFLADGSLLLMGRIDQQVKLRGFRIELGEIEAALAQHPGVREAIVVARDDAPGEKRLVAYVVENGEPRTENLGDDSDGSRSAKGHPVLGSAELREHLGARLPAYMVPSAFVVLDALPQTPNGKIDRRALPKPDEERQQHTFVAPRTPVEQTLAAIWSAVLGVQQLGIHDNFFALGGDSILSIQIIARAHQAGIHLHPRQLFQHQTIAELAAVADAAPVVVSEQGPVTGAAPLTPIQRWLFAQQQPDPQHVNQALLFESRQPLDPALLRQAIKHLLLHHDVLRARFDLGGDTAQAVIAAPDDDVPFVYVDLAVRSQLECETTITATAAELQGSLDLQAGPLLRVALFDLGAERASRLLVIMHHLVVDGVSWRIILDDLQLAYRQLAQHEPVRLPSKTTSFKAWAERLAAYGRSEELRRERDYWLDLTQQRPACLPVDNPSGANTVASARTLTVTLSAEETAALLHQVPQAYRTQINDVLLTALAQGISSWAGSARLLVDLEGHGREDLFDDVDVSRTVGWFTTIYPVLLDLRSGAQAGTVLKAIKEQLRRVPRRGIGYGLLRYLSADPEIIRALESQPQAEISFNYLGQVDQALAADSLFRPGHEPIGPLQSPRNQRGYLLEINSIVAGGQLRLTWIYGEQIHRRETVERLAHNTLTALRQLILHCVSPLAGGYTPSDFPLATLDQPTLDRLFGAERGIEDVYPLTPTQQGMLFHTLYTPEGGMYVEQLCCVLRGDLNLAEFARAWQQTIDRHSILRTAIVWEGLAEPLQVVRRDVSLPWTLDDWRDLPPEQQESRLGAYVQADRARGFQLDSAPLMRLAIFRLADDVYQIVWTSHHLLLDGWSLPLVLNEVVSTYLALCQKQPIALAQPRPYRDYIAWLQRQDLAQAERFWHAMLADFQAPTPLVVDSPGADSAAGGAGYAEERLQLSATMTADVTAIARQHGLTLNTIIQGAWALLLSRYSRENDVVFGATVSGRPAGLDGIETMVGLFINTLPVRVTIDPQAALHSWLAALQAQQAELRQYEYSPLAQVQSWSAVPRGLPLFESIVVFENYPVVAAARAGSGTDLAIENVKTTEQTNYPLTLVVVPGDVLMLRLSYDRSRFAAPTMRRMLGHIEQLVAGFAASLDRLTADVPLVTAAEQAQLLAMHGPLRSYPATRGVHQLFEDHAAQAPAAIALVCDGDSLSYSALNRRANQLAHYLRS
ncbi:MAG TPA: amino acid adenylation domain-containing protein, partial [Herpetosiphonaceae bacterium]